MNYTPLTPTNTSTDTNADAEASADVEINGDAHDAETSGTGSGVDYVDKPMTIFISESDSIVENHITVVLIG